MIKIHSFFIVAVVQFFPISNLLRRRQAPAPPFFLTSLIRQGALCGALPVPFRRTGKGASSLAS